MSPSIPLPSTAWIRFLAGPEDLPTDTSIGSRLFGKIKSNNYYRAFKLVS